MNMVMITHKLRMTVRTRRQRETLGRGARHPGIDYDMVEWTKFNPIPESLVRNIRQRFCNSEANPRSAAGDQNGRV